MSTQSAKIYGHLLTTLAENVKRLRETHGWSQEEAAWRSEMPTRVFQRIESAGVNLTMVTFARLCHGFSVQARDLLNEATPTPQGSEPAAS